MTIDLESIPDDAIEAAQDAFHEFAFGLEEPLTKREKGITRLAYRAAIHAALKAMSWTPLDPEPWEMRSADFGNFRFSRAEDVPSGYRANFSPRPQYSQSREDYDD